ncbi:hypothetical protein E2562_034366 [Oryza meyeriana var. granulata]|uniref:Uncharacterized protein n=1 Tax=Oryza meyeriana var. granulata TaxID=110450 RepID=A0A6G1FF40_9ORYZ|nr:hypothetical protein E2562_034366 [Oryza meyeriana var. granulata]
MPGHAGQDEDVHLHKHVHACSGIAAPEWSGPCLGAKKVTYLENLWWDRKTGDPHTYSNNIR